MKNFSMGYRGIAHLLRIEEQQRFCMVNSQVLDIFRNPAFEDGTFGVLLEYPTTTDFQWDIEWPIHLHSKVF